MYQMYKMLLSRIFRTFYPIQIYEIEAVYSICMTFWQSETIAVDFNCFIGRLMSEIEQNRFQKQNILLFICSYIRRRTDFKLDRRKKVTKIARVSQKVWKAWFYAIVKTRTTIFVWVKSVRKADNASYVTFHWRFGPDVNNMACEPFLWELQLIFHLIQQQKMKWHLKIFIFHWMVEIVKSLRAFFGNWSIPRDPKIDKMETIASERKEKSEKSVSACRRLWGCQKRNGRERERERMVTDDSVNTTTM